MATDIDIEVLREVLTGAERMVRHHQADDLKRQQNEALKAAGLPTIHSEFGGKWASDEAARYSRQAECLRHVIAYHEGRIYVREEAMVQLASELGDELADEIAQAAQAEAA